MDNNKNYKLYPYNTTKVEGDIDAFAGSMGFSVKTQQSEENKMTYLNAF